MLKKFSIFLALSLVTSALLAQNNAFLDLYQKELITSDQLAFHLNGQVYPRSLFFPSVIEKQLVSFPVSQSCLRTTSTERAGQWD